MEKLAGRITNWQLWAYAMPGLAISLLISPFPAIISAFYARYTAATTAGIALVLLATRFTDILIDPSIGYLSDATLSPWGARKPWLVGGVVVGVIAFAILFRPSPDVGNGYFAIGMLLYYLALAVIDIPLRSWAGEMAPDYRERSRIAGRLTFMLLLGGVAFFALPNILALPQIGLAKTAEIDRPMLSLLGWIGMALLPATVALAVAIAPSGRTVAHKRERLIEMMKTVRLNRPFWLFLGADILTQIAWGLTYAVLFIALETYYGLGDKVALVILVATFAQILAIPLCLAVSSRFGKHLTWGWASIGIAAITPVLFLFPPHGAANFGLLCLYIGVNSALGAPNMIFPMAMLSDIADYDTLKTRQNRNGSYYALHLVAYKGAFAIGNALGFFMLSVVQYNPKIAYNPPFATWGMLSMLAIVPAVLFLGAGLFLLVYPINAKRHAIIRRRIGRLTGVGQ